MQSTEKSIMNKLYFTSGAMFIFALLVVYKLVTIQFVEGERYRSLADDRTIKDVTIPANRGNVYSVGGSLLATSVPKYDIRIDLVAPTNKNYEAFIEPLCDSLANFNNTSSAEYKRKLRLARENKNRYFLLATKLRLLSVFTIQRFPTVEFRCFQRRTYCGANH